MLLNDGVATFYRGRNIAEKGAMPNIVYDDIAGIAYYGEKTVGITRFWTAHAHDARADLLIQIQHGLPVTVHDRVTLAPYRSTNAAGDYRILQIQNLLNEDGQPVCDLTLERVSGIDGT